MNKRTRQDGLCKRGHLVTSENGRAKFCKRNGKTYFMCRECEKLGDKYRLISELSPEDRERRRETCRRTTERHRVRYRENVYRKLFGLTYAQRDAMLASQGGRCANPGCRAIEPAGKGYWHTDHDHKTGKVRGILCHHCNLALGNVKDSPERLRGLIAYLQDHDSVSGEPTTPSDPEGIMIAYVG